MTERSYIIGQDDEAILELRAKVWGRDHPHTNPEFFQWLFHDTPHGKGAGVVILNEEDDVIGFAGLSRRKAQFGADPISVCLGLEFMVDPLISGMVSGRVGTRIMAAHKEMAENLGYDCSLNFPNDNSVRMLTSKRGKYDLVFEPDIFIQLLPGYSISSVEHPNFLKRTVMSLGGKATSLYSSLRALGAGKGIEIEEINSFDNCFDEFWKHLQTDGHLRFVRDAKTLNWRYVNHPLYSYRMFVALKDEKVIGYIVISPRDVMGTEAYLICDLCVVDGQKKVYEGLLCKAISEARKNKKSALVGQYLPDDQRRKSLSRCGFIGLPSKFNPKQFRMVAMSFNDQGSAVLAADNWSFNWGDMDVV